MRWSVGRKGQVWERAYLSPIRRHAVLTSEKGTYRRNAVLNLRQKKRLAWCSVDGDVALFPDATAAQGRLNVFGWPAV
eukprot:363545-Chlamydomonas_euryale.AAC.4